MSENSAEKGGIASGNTSKSTGKTPKLTYLILVFSCLGLLVLGWLSYIATPPEVPLVSLEDHIGEQVVSRGVLVYQRELPTGEMSYILYDDRETIEVISEFKAQEILINDIVEASGIVYEGWNGKVTLRVEQDRGLSKVGVWEKRSVDIADIPSEHGSYIEVRDRVFKRFAGYGDSHTIMLGDPKLGLEVTLNWQYVEDAGLDLGDEVSVIGICDAQAIPPRIMCYSNASLKIEAKAASTTMALSSLCNDLEDLSPFPVNVTGYLAYEPTDGSRSFILADLPTRWDHYITVSHLNTLGSEVHKGDQVEVSGLLDYDPQKARYYIELVSLEITASYGIWNITLDELAGYPSSYLGAQVQISGIMVYENDTIILTDPDRNLGLITFFSDEGVRSDVNSTIRSDGALSATVLGSLNFSDTGLFYHFQVAELLHPEAL